MGSGSYLMGLVSGSLIKEGRVMRKKSSTARSKSHRTARLRWLSLHR